MGKNPRLYFAVISISFASLFALALALDPLAEAMGRTKTLIAVSNVLSFLGNGIFLTAASIAFAVAGRIIKGERLKNAGRECLISVAVAGIAVNLLKAVFERQRMGYHGNPVLLLLENPSFFDPTGRFGSFPSGHTSISFAFAYALAGIYPPLRFLLYPLSLLVALSRIYLTSHYPTDTVAAAALGLGVSWLISQRKKKETLKHGALFFLVIFVSFFKLGSFLLFDLDEAVFSEAAREMLSTGDFMTPLYNFLPRYDKPIFFYWLLASAFKLFGQNEFSARFFSALFGAALAMMTFFFVRRVNAEGKGAKGALWSTLVLVVNLAYFVYTHAAITDMVLTFFVGASLYSFYLGVTENNRRWFLLFWIASAFSMLTKGAVGVVFPVSIAFLYLLASKNTKRLKELFSPACILIFFALALPWFAAQFYINGREFFDAFILKHHIERYTEVSSGHRGPFYYYIVILAAGFFPWVLALPNALWKGITKSWASGNGLYTFGAIWFLFILIFFTVARTKLPNYILPLFPAASILTGSFISEFIETNGSRKWLYGLSILSFIFAAASAAVPFAYAEAATRFHPLFFFILGWIFLAVSGLSLAAISRPASGLLGIGGATVLLLAFIRVYGLPPVNLLLQKTLYTYSTYVKTLDGKGPTLATYRINNPSINFYSGRKTLNLGKRDLENLKDLSVREDLIVITKTALYGELKDMRALRVMHKEDDYIMLTNIAGKLPGAGLRLEKARTVFSK